MRVISSGKQKMLMSALLYRVCFGLGERDMEQTAAVCVKSAGDEMTLHPSLHQRRLKSARQASAKQIAPAAALSYRTLCEEMIL